MSSEGTLSCLFSSGAPGLWLWALYRRFPAWHHHNRNYRAKPSPVFAPHFCSFLVSRPYVLEEARKVISFEPDCRPYRVPLIISSVLRETAIPIPNPSRGIFDPSTPRAESPRVVWGAIALEEFLLNSWLESLHYAPYPFGLASVLSGMKVSISNAQCLDYSRALYVAADKVVTIRTIPPGIDLGSEVFPAVSDFSPSSDRVTASPSFDRSTRLIGFLGDRDGRL